MFVRGRGSQGVVLILSVVLSAMLAMPVLMAYADADAAGRGTWANAEDETFADVGSRDEGGLEASDEPGQSDVEGEQGQTGQIEDPANPEVPEGSQDLTGPADDPANDPADPADDSAGSAGSTDDPADPAGPAGDPAGPAADAAPPAASPSLPENDSPDGSAYRGATLRRTPLYASPDASQPEADFLWGGVVVGGVTRWDAAGEWQAVAYGGGRYFARASDVSLNDGSGSRVAVTLSRTPAYEAPDASLPEAEFFWGGVSLSASAWDAAGEWLAVPYRGATYFVRSDALSSADSPDGSAYRGATLRRTPLYASPDASQPEADFLWGGVVVGGFTRWDAAGEWLAVAYGGGRYFARASDVSLNDAPGRDVPYVGRTLGRVSMRPSPDLSSEPFDFFWGGVEVPAAPWDAAGEWVLSSYRGQAAFLPADSVELVPRYYRQEGTAMYLDIEWAGQPNGYYCGPASGYMVLNHLGAHTSESGVSLTMDNLAGYMGVDSSGTDSTGFLNALNNWLGRYDYQLIASPAYDQVHSAVMDAFSTGYPTVVHTYERRGGPHYNGHGNSSMGHFMVVDGYDTATDAVYIADPWAGVWSASSQKFWYPSLREFTATYITPYRYVYFH